MCFWDIQKLDANDAINQSIWANSPIVQWSIHRPCQLRHPGSVGAQQAMLANENCSCKSPPLILPWIPDLVGKNWRHEESVMVVGSSYAGIISEYENSGRQRGRQNMMSLSDYSQAALINSPVQFQGYFMSSVVIHDCSYYCPIEILCQQLGSCANICALDLCRASFVKRANSGQNGQRKDEYGDKVVGNNCLIFDRYITHKTSMSWTWDRLTTGKARRIIALGSIAEHGLIRLFIRKGMFITRQLAPKTPWNYSHRVDWAQGYADGHYKLDHWIKKPPDWWIISGSLENGKKRTWHMLPVYHPSVYTRYDKDYKGARSVLAQM